MTPLIHYKQTGIQFMNFGVLKKILSTYIIHIQEAKNKFMNLYF